LNLSCLNYWHEVFVLLLLLVFLILRCLIDLLLAREVQLPDVVGNRECLALVIHL
jgi:hypothetical protein